MVSMRWLSLHVGILSAAMAGWVPGHAGQVPEHTARPFSFFDPVVELRADHIERIRSGRVVTQAIPGSGHDLAVLAAG
jgi:hypothetical protein